MSKGNRYPTQIQVTGKEKRHKPTKHYVFIVQVRWSDGTKVPIYRQYSDFHQLHEDIQDLATCLQADGTTKITLPTFPAKKAFERAEISKAASVRRHAFDGYLKGVLEYEALAKSKAIFDFFMPTSEDIAPSLAPPVEKERRKSSILTALTELFPKKDDKPNIKKSRSGVNLNQMAMEEEDPVYVSSPLILETYLVLADYMPQEKGEVQLKEGHFIQVIEKHTTGWWFLSTEYGDGWGPATHLQPLDEKENDEPEPIYSGSKYITTNSYDAPSDAKDEISFPQGATIDVLHKLMDGWWVIKYQGEVGYAPATYLAPLKNPHYKESRYGLRRNKHPTTRRTTLKNSKGKSVSSLRDRSRDLSIYKKLSTPKSNNEVDEKPAKMSAASVRFKNDVEFEGLQRAPSPSNESTSNSNDQAKSSNEQRSHSNEPRSVEVKRAPRQRTISTDSYECINDDDLDEMEDISTWVDANTLKKKQAEASIKRDYMNVPKLTISAPSEEPKPQPIDHIDQSESEIHQASTETHKAAPPPPANARPKSTSQPSSPDTMAPHESEEKSSMVDKSAVESFDTNANMENKIVPMTDETDSSAQNEIESQDKLGERVSADKSDEGDIDHPEEIANVLQSIRKKKIRRIYSNENGELVIQFVDPNDAASFGVCSIKDDSCPVTDHVTLNNDSKQHVTQNNNTDAKPKEPPYAKVNKKRISSSASGQYDNAEPEIQKSDRSENKLDKPHDKSSNSVSNNNKSKPAKNKTKTGKGPITFPELEDEFTVFV